MDEYLAPTALCDCGNAELKKKAQEIIEGAGTPKAAALKIFSFVRELPWTMDAFDAKASKTLKKKKGVCENKANLQVALLRASGIPARYHQANLKKEFGKGIVSEFLYNRGPDPIWFHSWCECYLDGKWVACQALLDEALYKAMLQEGLVTAEQIPTIDWDGKSDLIVVKSWLGDDVGTFPSPDDLFKKAQKETSSPRILTLLFGCLILWLSNRRTDSVRKKWMNPAAAPEKPPKPKVA
jgi:hypothetical protein